MSVNVNLEMSKENEIINLKEQLKVARTELCNLRQKIQNMTRGYQKDVEKLRSDIKNWKCENCKVNTTLQTDLPQSIEGLVNFKPIGIIRTNFPDKKGTPRQPNIVSSSKGRLELFPDVFTNPEHSLEGLQDFSHMWVLFHFHKHTSHARSKVAPPRLNGLKVGVFGSRSPHRPNPLGLSLVKIDEVNKSYVDFFGVDMVDNTPVFDIKPYIPSYDNPSSIQEQYSGFEGTSGFLSEGDIDTSNRSTPLSPSFQNRGAPDGEEEETDNSQILLPSNVREDNFEIDNINIPSINITSQLKPDEVRVPSWVTQKPTITVNFTDKAVQQINDLNADQKAILDVLQADPRSVYLRKRYGGQFFIFLMNNLHVTCRFQDDVSICTVFCVRKAEQMDGECSSGIEKLQSSDN